MPAFEIRSLGPHFTSGDLHHLAAKQHIDESLTLYCYFINGNRSEIYFIICSSVNLELG